MRHKSSYRFFRSIVEADIVKAPGRIFRILDLGCGVGHGAYALSTLPNVQIVAIDPSAESISYASENYPAENISYVNANAESFLERREVFDYIVSRHALEHVENGLQLARKYQCLKRLMINVPYKEPEGNIHHKVHFIDEESFVGFDGAEFFYEDLKGITETTPEKLEFANSIVCILTKDASPKVADILKFPFGAWRPALYERIIIETSTSLKTLLERVNKFEEEFQHAALSPNQIRELEKNISITSTMLADIALAKAELNATRAEIAGTITNIDTIQSMFLFRMLRKMAEIVKKISGNKEAT
ncbi:methyltransferase domain-containing protein [Brucella sp. 09RB8918]|nr:methyltransferase domain-containing protein [Brucella sp. 09RB8913]MRN58670.1 methyltransferase domain-containing protein [Brucella sp. 09RB8918]